MQKLCDTANARATISARLKKTAEKSVKSPSNDSSEGILLYSEGWHFSNGGLPPHQFLWNSLAEGLGKLFLLHRGRVGGVSGLWCLGADRNILLQTPSNWAL
jgi:hypothetical protein